MPKLTANDFSAFFEAVHNKPDVSEVERKQPFDWQKRLAKQVLEAGRWPDVIRVPTACGKTSVLDIALFELALQAGRQKQELTAARRICFVIDRRLVVDEVTEHARSLYVAIMAAAQGKRAEPVLKAVAERLASLAAEDKVPLRVIRLRGGVYRNDGWAADPLTPTILVSTVDQIGSRLLFRGYGVGRSSRPVHAGLLAFDTRILLDEAHLSTVFAETLDRVRQYQQWAEKSPVPENRRVSVVCMSATAGEGKRPFPESREQWKEMQDARLTPRLDANKPTELVVVKVESIKKDLWQKQPGKAWEQERRNREELIGDIVKHAKRIAALGGNVDKENTKPPLVIGIVVNRVATARKVFEFLSRKGKTEQERDAILLTGRIRPFDRDRLLEEWLPRMKAGRANEPARPLFVVATQTVEVGANLDFDALITEAAPLDALRQRFGRLDRLGKRYEQKLVSPGIILIRSDQTNKSENDPIYGQSIAETWKWLDKKGSKKKGQPKQINFGVNHLDPKLPETLEQLRPLLATPPEPPLLFPAHLDAWVQTNPMPDPDPDVAPFLHGQADAAADVQVVWCADLEETAPKAWAGIVRLMPPRIREALPVPLYEIRAWLQELASGDVSDVEGTKQSAKEDEKRRGRRVLRWRR